MEHEKSIIPAIVTRCIQEVELRGMFDLHVFGRLVSNKFIRYGHGGHLSQIWCRFRHPNHS